MRLVGWSSDLPDDVLSRSVNRFGDKDEYFLKVESKKKFTMYGLPSVVVENFISAGRTPLSLSILLTSNRPMSVPLQL